MATLFYGNGEVEISGYNIRGLQIEYIGKAIIDKECLDDFQIIANNDRILVFPIGQGFLNGVVFCYEGSIDIKEVIVADENAKKINCTIKKVMDYFDLIEGNIDTASVDIEKLGSSNKKGTIPKRTKVKQLSLIHI